MEAIKPCDTAFKQAVLLQCFKALETAGFIRYRKEYVDWPLGSGFHCWVGLNNNLEREYFQINPFVGMHVVPIEKLWTSLKKGKYPGKYSRNHATYAVYMGELAPQKPVFKFTRQTNIEAEATRLAQMYVDIGLPYASGMASYEHLLPLLLERVPMLGAYPERAASCLYLMDRKEDARTFVEKFLMDHRDYFESFAAPFLKLLAH